ncbi:MAG: toll/interleukin-1 receptor domain-containing protein, partial [Lachnospiraceae bacterium]|nr:toll/interleukin-1 receptor domain-containing protein [Lachnospiraceae bacterium]
MERDHSHKYNAFISYRHAEPDMTVAKRLQELLERYVPPRSAEEAGDKRIRLFRDEDELHASGDLSDEIRDALASSEFLIVICSPNLADSKWCAEELRIFRDLHGGSTDQIIAVVADGDVQEVLPPELNIGIRTVVTASGEEVREEVFVEPLAANVAADTPREREKKLKKEYLRVAAPLLHVSYPTLHDRHQKRRTKRLITGGALVLAAVAVFAATVTTMLLRIRTQNVQLEEQTVALSRSRSDLLAEQSLQALENHDRTRAVELALEALPGDDDPALVTAKTEYALAEAVNAYRTENRSAIPRTVRTYTGTEALRMVATDEKGEGAYVALLDGSGTVFVYHTESAELICQIPFEGSNPV